MESVLGHYFELPDEDKEATLLMQIASMCLEQGIPLSHAQRLTLLHPVLNRDKMLLEKIFQTVYSVAEQEDYLKKHTLLLWDKGHPRSSLARTTRCGRTC